MKTGQPPGGTLLPVEPTRPFPVDALEASLERRAGGLEPYTMSSADFDIVLLTPTGGLPRTARAHGHPAHDQQGDTLAEPGVVVHAPAHGLRRVVRLRIGDLASAPDPRHAQVRRGVLDEGGARRGADTGRGPAALQTLQVGIRPAARAVRRRRGDADPPLRTGNARSRSAPRSTKGSTCSTRAPSGRIAEP